MELKTLFVFAFAILAGFVLTVNADGKKHHKVIIHVPHHIKTIKHTHTIYKIIHHKPEPKEHHHDHHHVHHEFKKDDHHWH